MSHHHRTGGSAGSSELAGMPPISIQDDWPLTSRGLPVRTGTAPSATTGPAPDRFQAFTETVLGLHRVLADRFIPMCSCGSPARYCPIVRAEHDVLGIAMPFDFGPLARPLYYEV
ncbi:MAG TPA: hypothetical protein VFX70_15760 [Mycobacteriales bacterium]|nr:hypothetical protein [Mycobacteriales bacterium]